MMNDRQQTSDDWEELKKSRTHAPPPHALTREQVETTISRFLSWHDCEPECDHDLREVLATDAAQRETIRRLTRDLDWQTKAHNACRDEIAILQSRLTASEAKHKDDLRHYQASVMQLLRLVTPAPMESWNQSIIDKANHLLGIHGPLTPGEE